jgi:hypothetical protein
VKKNPQEEVSPKRRKIHSQNAEKIFDKTPKNSIIILEVNLV